MLRSAEIYLGRDPANAIWLATLHAINVHPERVSILIASLDPGRAALEATDLALTSPVSPALSTNGATTTDLPATQPAPAYRWCSPRTA